MDLKPEKVYVPEIKEKSIKNISKVAVIIPTKGKLELLLPCLDSFYEQCNPNLFDIFIADTGSSDEEKNQIKNYISLKSNINLIEYDYYNFAKINNDVVKNHINDSYEFLLFCNNDIKLLNNVVYGMLKVFKENPRTGTVGARLHLLDNTIQHDGIILYVNKDRLPLLKHKNSENYYNYSNELSDVIGNTAGLMMIRKNTFINFGMFNEEFRHCFEDVELNLQLKLNNLTNQINSKCVAYHYQSQSRNIENTSEEMNEDYINIIFPLIRDNIGKLKNDMFYTK